MHHQGSSRQTLKNESSPHRRAIPTRHAPSPPSLDVGRSMLDVGCFGPIPHLRLSASICGSPPCPPISAPDSASIKAKTPLIVHDQGSSRQTLFFPNCHHSVSPSAGWGGPAVEGSKRMPGKTPLLGRESGGLTTNNHEGTRIRRLGVGLLVLGGGLKVDMCVPLLVSCGADALIGGQSTL